MNPTHGQVCRNDEYSKSRSIINKRESWTPVLSYWLSTPITSCRDDHTIRMNLLQCVESVTPGIHTGDKVDCRRYDRLCCRFWRQISNILNSTASRGRHCRQLGRLCRQCVPGFKWDWSYAFVYYNSERDLSAIAKLLPCTSAPSHTRSRVGNKRLWLRHRWNRHHRQCPTLRCTWPPDDLQCSSYRPIAIQIVHLQDSNNSRFKAYGYRVKWLLLSA